MFKSFMNKALEEAVKALEYDEIPIGAIIIDSYTGNIISRAHNLVYTNNDPTAHAEILVLKKAAQILKTPYLDKCDLYVTIEPCAMCAQAISWSRIRRVYFGAEDVKSGAIENGVCLYGNKNCHHKPEVYSGMMSGEASKLLQDFFSSRRSNIDSIDL